MAMFSFLRRLGIVVVTDFLLQLVGLLSLWSTLGLIRQGHAVANVPISEPDIKFIILPSSNRVTSPNNGAQYLSCLVSIRDEAVYSSANFEYPFHIWLRNGESIVPRKNEFQIFENGTLKIFPGEKATGSYRCLVNGTEIDAGILLSNETIVQNAVFKRKRVSTLNTTVTIGDPTILQCPILSVPKANISWMFDGKNINDNRFLILESGSLLILNTTKSDQGKFKCIAKNKYSAKGHRQFSWSLSVVLEDRLNYTDKEKNKLLPSLQNSTIYIEAGRDLRLHCASYFSDSIDWTFTPRSYSDHTFSIRNQSSELVLKNVTVSDNDGWYRCSTKSDYQIYNVTVITPPIITKPVENWESSVAAQASFNCHATGNPKPTITWYRNGVLLENGLRIYYNSRTLYINSIDLDEGIYQCFAKNIAGEAFSSGRLVLRRKDEWPHMPQRPENVACYPINYETVLVTFSMSAPLSYITPHFATKHPILWKTVMPLRLTSTTNFTSLAPVLRSFTLFLRGMVETSKHRTMNGEESTFDTSLLSDGTLCSTQGMRVNTVFLQSGIFIFWTPMNIVKAKYFRIQFLNNKTNNILSFGDTIVGTTNLIDLDRTRKDDINKWLLKMPVLNINQTASDSNEGRIKRSIDRGGYSTESGKQGHKKLKKTEKRDKETSESEALITEVSVPGNVTGMLIPNVQNIGVRVLIITEENEDLNLNLKYVDWKSISLHPQLPFQDRHIRVSNVESRSITMLWNPIKSVTCIKVCYFVNSLEAKIRQTDENVCQNIYELDMYFTIRKLLPSTIYHMEFFDCYSSSHFGMVDIKTLPDAPGPVANQKIVRNNGYELSWDPPINPNGEIIYYNIEWNGANSVHSANVTHGKNVFKFPNVTEDEKINITIRAVGTSGIGLPIYMNLHKVQVPRVEGKAEWISDPILGIVVGILLCAICILVFICIFIKQRKRFKGRGCGQSGSLTSPSDSHCPQTPASNIELRELQTLIPKPSSLQIVGDTMNALPRNGIFYGENDGDISRAICTSTPNAKKRAGNGDLLSDRLFQEHGVEVNGSNPVTNTSPVATSVITTTAVTPMTTTLASSILPPNSTLTPLRTITLTDADELRKTTATQLLNKNSSSPNYYISNIHSNGNTTKLQNGSIKTTLPPNKHSTQAAAATTDLKSFKANGSIKNKADSLQYLADPKSNTSATSRQQLIDTTLDSSATTTFSQLNDTRIHPNNHRPHPALLHHHHHQHHHPNSSNRHNPTKLANNQNKQNLHSTLNDSPDTTTSTLDMDDSIRNVNLSSSSCNPLLKSSNWNFRRPIVEPNG